MTSRSSQRQATFAARPMSRADAEVIAERVLARVYPQNLVTPTRLDVLGLMDGLEDHFNIGFGVADLPRGEEGYLDWERQEIIISTGVYRRLERGDGRARATCCHEAGHIPHINQVKTIIRDGGPQLARRFNVQVPAYRDPEWQAHAVGSALIMPRTTVPEVYRRGGIYEVAEFYQVSDRHAEVRISVLSGLGVL